VWASATSAWTEAQWPRLAAYTSVRRAEALARAGASRTDVAAAFEAAVARARAIESSLLMGVLSALAARAGIDAPAPPSEPEAPSAPTVAALTDLTKREREVLELVTAGATNRQIAARLFISEKTASVHVSRILTKLGASSRQEAAALARRAGRARRS
jgi:DNA-binding NarL/FixJ family response regulator